MALLLVHHHINQCHVKFFDLVNLTGYISNIVTSTVQAVCTVHIAEGDSHTVLLVYRRGIEEDVEVIRVQRELREKSDRLLTLQTQCSALERVSIPEPTDSLHVYSPVILNCGEHTWNELVQLCTSFCSLLHT